MSFNLFRVIFFISFLVVAAFTARPYDAVSWCCVAIGIMGAAWVIYWLPVRIYELQEQYGDLGEQIRSQFRNRK